MIAKLLSSLDKCFLDENIYEKNEFSSGSAFKNEIYSFQLAMHCAQGDARQYYMEIQSDIRDCISVRRVRHVPVMMPMFGQDDNYLRTKPGLYPDMLEPFNIEKYFYIYNDCTDTFWFTVENAPAGKHEITIIIKLYNQIHIKKTFTLEVIDAALPEQELVVTNWFHSDCLSTYYNTEVFSERYWEIVENFMKNYVKNGMNLILTPVLTPALDTAVGYERPTVQLVDITFKNGVYRYGFKNLDRWVALCQKCGIKYFEIAHLFSQWGAKATPKVMATVDGEYKRIFGWETSSTSPEYKKFLRSFLKALVNHLKKLGVDKQCFFHISDEPHGEEALKTYKQCRKIVANILKDYVIMDALSDFEFYKQGITKTPIPCNNKIEPFIEAGVPDLWTYYCCSQTKDVSNQFIAMPSARNRIIGTQMYKYRIYGFLQWGFNFYYSQISQYPINPYVITDADGIFSGGDPFKVYPGMDGNPIESIREVVFTEALQDMRAMKMLEKLTSYDYVMSLVEQNVEKPITFSEYPHSACYILGLREKINTAIKEHLK